MLRWGSAMPYRLHLGVRNPPQGIPDNAANKCYLLLLRPSWAGSCLCLWQSKRTKVCLAAPIPVLNEKTLWHRSQERTFFGSDWLFVGHVATTKFITLDSKVRVAGKVHVCRNLLCLASIILQACVREKTDFQAFPLLTSSSWCCRPVHLSHRQFISQHPALFNLAHKMLQQGKSFGHWFYPCPCLALTSCGASNAAKCMRRNVTCCSMFANVMLFAVCSDVNVDCLRTFDNEAKPIL